MSDKVDRPVADLGPDARRIIEHLERHIPRRRFLQSMALTGAAMAGGSALVRASARTSDGHRSGIGSAEATGSVIYGDLYPSLPMGGSMIYGVPNQVANTLNPLSSVAFAVFFATDPMNDWLEHYDTTGTLVPSLAQSMDFPSENEIRYVLHDGIFFHNGRQMTAQDIADVIAYVKDEANASPVKANFDPVEVSVVDDQTVILRSDPPIASIRSHLTRLPIIPVEEAATLADNPVGAGPFRFAGWERDQYVDFERFDDYWNPEAPRLDTMRSLQIPDDVSGNQTLLAGQMDANLYVSPTEFSQFESRPEFGSLVEHWGWSYVLYNHARSPYDQPQVRQAIRLAMDRSLATQAPYGGLGLPQFFPGIRPESPFYPADLEYAKDVEAAKTLLAEAGLASGFSDTLLTINFPVFQSLSTIVQALLREIGINVELEVVDLATYIDRVIANKDYSIATLGDGNDPEPAFVLDRYFMSNGGSNWTNYANPEVDELLVAANSTFDEAERQRLYHRVYEIVAIEDSVLVPLSTEPFPSVFKSEINGELWIPTPNERVHFPIAARRS
jgi:peptide/nickel transport system substrate-binding protein